jgi:hypothetical protein
MLSVIGGISVIMVAGWLLIRGYLRHAAIRRTPAFTIASATDRIAPDPFLRGPTIGDVLVILFAILGLVAILAVAGAMITILKARRRRQQGRSWQPTRQRTFAQPHLVAQNDTDRALNALVQLELTHYLQGMRGQNEGHQPRLPQEQPLVVRQLGPDPVDNLLREL